MHYRITWNAYFENFSYTWDKIGQGVYSRSCLYKPAERREWPERIKMTKREAEIFNDLIAHGATLDIGVNCTYEILED